MYTSLLCSSFRLAMRWRREFLGTAGKISRNANQSIRPPTSRERTLRMAWASWTNSSYSLFHRKRLFLCSWSSTSPFSSSGFAAKPHGHDEHLSPDHEQPNKSVPVLSPLFFCLRLCFDFLASSRAGPCSAMSCSMDFLG